MKRKLISVICCLFTALNCPAQSEHRISYTFGFLSHAYHQEREKECEFVEYAFPGPKDKGFYEYTVENLESSPLVYNLQYDYSLHEHIGLGLCMGYERQRMHQKTNTIKSIGEQESPFGNTYTLWKSEHRSGELKRRVLYIMPEVTAYWFKKRHVAMYSKGAIGVRLDFESRKFYTGNSNSEKLPTSVNSHVYYQISPVGIEVGGPYWRGNIEFGYGAQGYFQYGVRHIIKGKETSNSIIEIIE